MGRGRPRATRDEAQLHVPSALRRAGRGADAEAAARTSSRPPPPVLVLPLHGHLAPARGRRHRARPGYAGRLRPDARRRAPRGAVARCRRASRARAARRSRDRGAAYGGEHEAVSVLGALYAAAGGSAGTRSSAGPGPGILGSATVYGHGGIAALENAHAALALGPADAISPRLSASDPRPRHRGLSHHTEAVLSRCSGRCASRCPRSSLPGGPRGRRPGRLTCRVCSTLCTRLRRRATTWRWRRWTSTATGRAACPTQTMGRTLDEDPLFFAAPLAAGGRWPWPCE